MRHPDYPIWALIGLVLVLLPAPWHWRARNVSTVCLIGWLAVSNLIFFVNTLVWADNYADHSPIWCDISGRILEVISYAVPLCSFSQMRRLESVASPRQSMLSASARTRRLWQEAVICIALPILMMPLLYVVQGHRYDIYESIGCGIPDLLTWPALVLRQAIPLLIAILSLIYAGLAMRWFLVRRLQFRSILASSGSGLTTSRYLRLIALAVSDIALLLFSSLFSLIYRFTYFGEYVQSYSSWSDVHANFSLISQSAESAQVTGWIYYIVVSYYMAPLYSIVFFMFFGFGEEAITEYIAAGEAVRLLLEQFGLWKTRAPRVADARIPALGSTVVAVTDDVWVTRHDSASDDLDKPNGHLFDGLTERSAGDSSGIPVLVERSTV